jgi:hypothetical protein
MLGLRPRARTGDRVKFARVNAGPADCRAAVEEAYRLVDLTKPMDAPADAGRGGCAMTRLQPFVPFSRCGAWLSAAG